MDMHTWEPRFYKDYIGGLKVYQLDRANNATYVVELFEVYPKTITAQDLGYATNDAYHTIAVEFIYHHWKWVNDRTPFKKATNESIEAGPDEGTIYGHTVNKNQPTVGPN
jgi:hypothetical protein